MNKKKKLKSFLNITIFVVITCIVLYFALKDDYKSVIEGILHANILWLIVACLLVVSYWLFKAKIFYDFTRKFDKTYTYRKAFKLQLVTNFFNAVTPFSSGGQPFQIYTLKKQGVSLVNSTSIIVQNFIVYQIALVTLGLVSIISNHFLHFFSEASFLKHLVTIGFIINTAIIIGLFIIAFARKINKKIINIIIELLSKMKIVKDKEKTLENWNEYINNFHDGAKLLIKDKIFFLRLVFCAILGLTCLYAVPVIILYATGDYTSFNIFESVVSCAYVMLIGSFVPIPGGTGGIEYGFVSFFGNFIKGSSLNVIMILWRFVTYYLGMLVGAVAVNIKEGKKKCE